MVVVTSVVTGYVAISPSSPYDKMFVATFCNIWAAINGAAIAFFFLASRAAKKDIGIRPVGCKLAQPEGGLS
jgi:hypothetical protein